MTSASYMSGRQRYARPQGMLWSENPGFLENGAYVPQGFEVGSDLPNEADPALANQFLILSDDNRGPMSFSTNRIERRERTINGRMRSYHIADKLSLSVAWQSLPSRSFFTDPNFDTTTGLSQYSKNRTLEHTSDGGAGGVELLDWYDNHQGPFWVFLSYDKYSNFGKEAEDFQKLGRYSQLVEMYISDFSYSVTTRGATNFDFWDINVTLEEV